MPSVDTVIVSYESAGTIGDCIAAAQALRDIGTVVVVDHGNDQSADVAKSLGARVIRDRSNPGFGAGQNRGIELTSGEFLLLLNPDAVIYHDAIEQGVEFLRSKPEAAAVTGVILDSDSGRPERSAGRAIGAIHLWGRALGLKPLLNLKVARSAARLLPTLRDHLERVPKTSTEVETLSATALLVRRNALEIVGGFDETFFMYGEDTDLCLRIRERGWQLYSLPLHWADHRWGSSTSDPLAREVLWWQGVMTFAARWFGSIAWMSAVGACTVRGISLSLRHSSRARHSTSKMLERAFRTRRSTPRHRGSRRSSFRARRRSLR